MSSYESKLQFIQQSQFQPPSLCYQLGLNYYGLNLKIKSDDSHFIEDLKKYHPSSWQQNIEADVVLNFISYNAHFDRSFFEEVSPEFNVFKFKEHLCCIQRDFVGWTKDKKNFTFLTDLKIDDGYFNCMRWAIPALLINSQAMVVHSSSVVDENGDCYMFLGQSGAGKTTTVASFKERIVLGDDMNIITRHKAKTYVHSGAIGGQIVYPRFDQEFPLKGLFWLRKNQKLNLERITSQDARLKMLGSLANIFFGFEDESFTDKVMSNIEQLIQDVPMYELSLMKGDNIWPLIQKV